MSIDAFIAALDFSLDVAARREFGPIERDVLKRALKICNMVEYPALVGPAAGERESGEMICEVCGQDYFSHPLDWRVIGYGDVPFLTVLCDGRRVKL